VSSHIDAIIIGCAVSFFGTIGTAFLALIWRRLDSIEKTTALIQQDQKEFYGITRKLEGRVDEISHRVK
jgi:hypothetical protein